MKNLLALLLLLLALYLTTALGQTVLCFFEKRADGNLFYTPHAELWRQCESLHLLFPFRL
jgi:hypothetical protein